MCSNSLINSTSGPRADLKHISAGSFHGKSGNFVLRLGFRRTKTKVCLVCFLNEKAKKLLTAPLIGAGGTVVENKNAGRIS